MAQVLSPAVLRQVPESWANIGLSVRRTMYFCCSAAKSQAHASGLSFKGIFNPKQEPGSFGRAKWCAAIEPEHARIRSPVDRFSAVLAYP
jgi:hypothetical protein